jgi:hypothetical protein
MLDGGGGFLFGIFCIFEGGGGILEDRYFLIFI